MIGAVRELAVHWRADRGSASVNVGVLSPATVLPLAEFEESTVETVYQFVFDGRRAPKTPRRVFYDMLPSSNGVLLFGVEERNCAEIEQELGEVHYFSPFSGLLQWMAGRKQTARQRRIFVHCRSTQIDVAYFEGHRIFAFNTFDVQTADDVLYSLASWRGSLMWTFPRHRSSFVGGRTRCRSLPRVSVPLWRRWNVSMPRRNSIATR